MNDGNLKEEDFHSLQSLIHLFPFFPVYKYSICKHLYLYKYL